MVVLLLSVKDWYVRRKLCHPLVCRFTVSELGGENDAVWCRDGGGEQVRLRGLHHWPRDGQTPARRRHQHGRHLHQTPPLTLPDNMANTFTTIDLWHFLTAMLAPSFRRWHQFWQQCRRLHQIPPLTPPDSMALLPDSTSDTSWQHGRHLHQTPPLTLLDSMAPSPNSTSDTSWQHHRHLHSASDTSLDNIAPSPNLTSDTSWQQCRHFHQTQPLTLPDYIADAFTKLNLWHFLTTWPAPSANLTSDIFWQHGRHLHQNQPLTLHHDIADAWHSLTSDVYATE